MKVLSRGWSKLLYGTVQLLKVPFIFYEFELFIATLHSRYGHCILQLWLCSSFFLAYFQRSQIGCLPYFHTWCGLSAKLECRSETCCTQLSENTWWKNYAKNRHLLTIAQVHRVKQCLWYTVIMVALCNRADHYIFILFLSFFLLSSFFPRLISAVGDWMFTILWHMVWP